MKVYLNYGVHDVNGSIIEIGTRFVISDTVKFVLSAGELGRHGWSRTLGITPSLTHEAGCHVPLTRKANTFCLSARFGFYGESPWKMVATTTSGSDSAVAAPSSHGLELPTVSSSSASGASGALLPPLVEALPAPVGIDVVPPDVHLRPVLSACNVPIYGTKDELWKRLCEYEARAEQQLRGRQWIEARKEEFLQGARPREAEILDAPSKPEDRVEIERHEVTHIPPMPWCLALRFGKGRDEDAASYDIDATVPDPWATILCAVDARPKSRHISSRAWRSGLGL